MFICEGGRDYRISWLSWNLNAQALVLLVPSQCEGMKADQDVCAVLDLVTGTGSFIIFTSFSQHILSNTFSFLNITVFFEFGTGYYF